MKKQTVVSPSRRRGDRHVKKDELEKRKQNKNATTCKQSKTKNQGKNDEKRKITGRPRPKQSTLQVAAAISGTRSIARFSLLVVVRLVPCYPDCRPAFVNYAQPLGVRQYETSRDGSSSNHATRLLQYGLSIRKGREKNKMKITESQRKKEKKHN